MSISTNRRRRVAALTLVELMFSIAIGMIALGAAMVLWGYATKTCATLMNYSEMAMSSKLGADTISQEIRNATVISSFSSSQLNLLDPDGTPVAIAYDSASSNVTYSKSGTTKTLLTGCTSFQFKLYQRVPQPGTDVLTEVFTTNLAKVVQMQWSCERQLTGDKKNVESLLSSKVVIRSK